MDTSTVSIGPTVVQERAVEARFLVGALSTATRRLQHLRVKPVYGGRMENGVENFGAPRVDLHETTSIFRQVVVARVSRRLGIAGTRAVVGRRYFVVVAETFTRTGCV